MKLQDIPYDVLLGILAYDKHPAEGVAARPNNASHGMIQKPDITTFLTKSGLSEEGGKLLSSGQMSECIAAVRSSPQEAVKVLADKIAHLPEGQARPALLRVDSTMLGHISDYHHQRGARQDFDTFFGQKGLGVKDTMKAASDVKAGMSSGDLVELVRKNPGVAGVLNEVHQINGHKPPGFKLIATVEKGETRVVTSGFNRLAKQAGHAKAPFLFKLAGMAVAAATVWMASHHASEAAPSPPSDRVDLSALKGTEVAPPAVSPPSFAAKLAKAAKFGP